MQTIPTSPLCLRGLPRPAPSDKGCAQMNGSGLAAVQALGVSRNTGLSRQMVPEAEASRLSLRPQGVHGPKQRKTDVCPRRHVRSTWRGQSPHGARRGQRLIGLYPQWGGRGNCLKTQTIQTERPLPPRKPRKTQRTEVTGTILRVSTPAPRSRTAAP